MAVDGPRRETSGEREFDYDRTVALSDGVFAIALTLLVLSISFPSLPGGAADRLGNELWDRRQEFFSYALSFLVISGYWIRHHGFFREITRIDRRLTTLNLVYLGLIAFVPYPTELLGRYGTETATVVVYAGTLGALGVLTLLMRRHAVVGGLASEQGRRALTDPVSRFRAASVPVIFVASIPIAFVSGHVAAYSWLTLLLAARLAPWWARR